jgi:hypothetical protein
MDHPGPASLPGPSDPTQAPGKNSGDPGFGRVREGVERGQRCGLSQGGRMSTMVIGLERDQLRLVGSRPGTAGKGPRMGAAGRICEASRCRTVLSRYNHAGLCWQHEPRHEYLSAVRGRRPAEVEVLSGLVPKKDLVPRAS